MYFYFDLMAVTNEPLDLVFWNFEYVSAKLSRRCDIEKIIKIVSSNIILKREQEKNVQEL
jgi:hypothetical protein